MPVKEPFYITTAISYPNGAPHIGHAYEAIATDALARHKRLDGHDVFFLTGVDVHGMKMQQTAEQEGMKPAELAEKNSALFLQMVDALNCSNDDFISTMEPRHYESSQAIWQRMQDAGDIYLDTYSGWYSVRDEAFYNVDETEEREDGSRVSKESQTEVTWTEEQTYFFRLSAYQDKLMQLYEAQPDFIAPKERRNEIMSFVAGGLQDLSVSRTTFDWGIPVPDAPGHIMYVWVDALTNYITGVGFPDENADSWKTYWPADVHIIGKDIIRFHAVYWPAFLMSAGLALPKRVFAHGFLFNKGEKMSKSIGNVIDPMVLADEFGVDQFRYFFLREVPFGRDGSYSSETMATRINADLANDLGNLAQRSLSMIAKNCDGQLPAIGDLNDEDRHILDLASAAYEAACTHWDTQAIHRALEAIWNVVAEANRYFAAQEPWALKKTDPDRMGQVLAVTAEVIRQIAILAQPVIPQAATKLLDLLAVPADRRAYEHLSEDFRLLAGSTIEKPEPVFPRYEAKDTAA